MPDAITQSYDKSLRDQVSTSSAGPRLLQGRVEQNTQGPELQAQTPHFDVQQPQVPVFGHSSEQYKPSLTGYPALKNHPAAKYIDKPGTVDLSRRQLVNNPQNPVKPDPREYGSEYSARDTLDDGRMMSYPTIYDGQVHPREEAFKYAKDSGNYLAIFKKGTPEKLMDSWENAAHSRVQNYQGQRMNGDRWAEMNRPQHQLQRPLDVRRDAAPRIATRETTRK